jgi:hypothetical protein
VALCYIKLNSGGIIPALIDLRSKEVIAATFKEKEALFSAQAFL